MLLFDRQSIKLFFSRCDRVDRLRVVVSSLFGPTRRLLTQPIGGRSIAINNLDQQI
jgi:hypothetical protein